MTKATTTAAITFHETKLDKFIQDLDTEITNRESAKRTRTSHEVRTNSRLNVYAMKCELERLQTLRQCVRNGNIADSERSFDDLNFETQQTLLRDGIAQKRDVKRERFTKPVRFNAAKLEKWIDEQGCVLDSDQHDALYDLLLAVRNDDKKVIDTVLDQLNDLIVMSLRQNCTLSDDEIALAYEVRNAEQRLREEMYSVVSKLRNCAEELERKITSESSPILADRGGASMIDQMSWFVNDVANMNSNLNLHYLMANAARLDTLRKSKA